MARQRDGDELARAPRGQGPARRVHLGRRQRHVLSHDVAQPAHPAVLRLLLGPRLRLGPGGPRQDRARREGRRHQPLGAAHPQLQRRRLVPRRLRGRPLPVAQAPLGEGRGHLLRVEQPLHGLLVRDAHGPLRRRRLDLHAHQRGQDLLHLPLLGRHVLGDRPLPDDPDRRLRLHPRRGRHAEGDLRARPHRLRHRRAAHPRLHVGRLQVHQAHRVRGPRHLRGRLGQGRGRRLLLDRAQLVGRVLGRDGLHPRGLRLAQGRGPVRLGLRLQLHGAREGQPGPLLRGRRELPGRLGRGPRARLRGDEGVEEGRVRVGAPSPQARPAVYFYKCR
mmetsp:Transcript_12811/g.38154  ORF Transcript_12811/g.38154 Transcript_12811/m.38154 type:complete len:333 (-) Transcript_12811:13-1011(-)